MVWYRWILGWIELFESILKVISLGFISPPWSLNFVFWHTKREGKRAQRENEAVDPA